MTLLFGKHPEPQPLKPKELIELDWEHHPQAGGGLTLRVLGIAKFADVDQVLEAIRDKRTIVVMKFAPQFFGDKSEVKRAIRRVQKTMYAIGGDIAGLSEDIIIVTPPIVNIERKRAPVQLEPEESRESRSSKDDELPSWLKAGKPSSRSFGDESS